jgi:hypothetical protein
MEIGNDLRDVANGGYSHTKDDKGLIANESRGGDETNTSL